MPGKTSTTWPKGKKPPVGRKKGTKNKRTVFKAAVGAVNWDSLKDFMETKGSAKMQRELAKLKGRAYTTAFNAMMEFIKPKLARTDHSVKASVTLADQETVFE